MINKIFDKKIALYLSRLQRRIIRKISPQFRSIEATQKQLSGVMDQVSRYHETEYFQYKKHKINHLEMHITHNCNLRCVNCSHFCDYQYDEKLHCGATLEWLKVWAKRLAPVRFRLMGGEPLLEKALPRYVKGAAEAFPRSRRELVTNGLLLPKWGEELPKILKDTETVLFLSKHFVDPPLDTVFERGFTLAREWEKKFGINLVLKDYTDNTYWTRFYQGDGPDIIPFSDGKPEESRFHCITKNCVNLHRGKLWQCPLLAYLPLVVDKLKHRRLWEPYLAYRPVEFTDSDVELAAFLNGRHGMDFCAMCPKESIPIAPRSKI